MFGLFLVFFALQSPLDPLSDHLLSFHQVQHFILRMVAPMLILLGAPLTPMLRGLPGWARQGVIPPAGPQSLRSPSLQRADQTRL